jgi:hypothetical protein
MKSIHYTTAQRFLLLFAASTHGTNEDYDAPLQAILDQAGITWGDLDCMALRARPVKPLTGEPSHDVPLYRLLPVFHALDGKGSIERAFALAGIPLPSATDVKIMKAACLTTELN